MSIIYTKELLEELVQGSDSIAEVIRKLGRPQSGGLQSHLKRRIDSFGIDRSHMTGQGHNKGKTTWNRKSPSEILVLKDPLSNKTGTCLLRRALLEAGVSHECSLCHNPGVWCGIKLVLQVDHIDGHSYDNRRGNLRFLCPNCHSQTRTFGHKFSRT